MSLDAERQAALQAAKLRALASSRWSVADDARAASFPEGASLVDAGADVNLPDRDGVTPLAHARQLGQAEMARLLQAAGAR